MSAPHSVEIATFRLKEGIPDDALLALEERIRAGQIAHEPGYLSRELAKDSASGEWLLVMRFETRAQLDTWTAKVKTVPEMRELGALFDPKSMTARFYESTG
jgi:hypothetical protein